MKINQKVISFFKSKNKSDELQNVFEKIDALLDSARSLFSQSESLKKVVVEEKESIQNSSSAATEISAMVATTASAAYELSEMAKESNMAVDHSLKSMESLKIMIDEVNKSSKALQESVNHGLKEIAKVTETMAEIKEKAKIINDIVFQTKLLSFNASVEAARAGEHGKGFSVVAEEIGHLARTSGAASKEIESILNVSVDRTHDQIKAVSTELEKVAKETVKAISEVGSKSNEITASFYKLSDYSKMTQEKSKEISLATKEQEVGVQEISKALRHLEQSSFKLDQMAQFSHQSSAELSSKVEQITSQFEIMSKSLGFGLIKPEKPFDFNAAISAHIDWKMKLSKYLSKPDGTLDHEKVCKDNACALGQWIYGQGQTYQDMNSKLYVQLKDSHAHFHKTAGHIIKLINNGQQTEASKLLSPSGEYTKISEKTVSLIQEIQNFTEEKKSAA